MVKTNVKFTNIESTAAIKDYLDKRLAKASRLAEQEQEEVMFEVELGKTTGHHREGDVYRAEVQTRLSGKELRAVTLEPDLYAAIDKAEDEIVREIKRVKNRAQQSTKRGGRFFKRMLRRLYK